MIKRNVRRLGICCDYLGMKDYTNQAHIGKRRRQVRIRSRLPTFVSFFPLQDTNQDSNQTLRIYNCFLPLLSPTCNSYIASWKICSIHLVSGKAVNRLYHFSLHQTCESCNNVLLDGQFGVKCFKVGSLKDGVENLVLVNHHNSGLKSSSRGTSKDLASSNLVESGLQDRGNRCVDDRPDVGITVGRQTAFPAYLSLATYMVWFTSFCCHSGRGA